MIEVAGLQCAFPWETVSLPVGKIWEGEWCSMRGLDIKNAECTSENKESKLRYQLSAGLISSAVRLGQLGISILC